MDFDRATISLLVLRPDAPKLDEKAEAELQDAHMAHLADLHEAGHLLAAGPLLSDSDREFRALVRAGRYSVKVMPWMVPNGAITS